MNNANHKNGQAVINIEDAEPATIVKVSTFRRNGVAAWSYLVKTAGGYEIWDASRTLAV